MPWAFLFCQNCGKSIRSTTMINDITVCEACTEVPLSLPAEADLGQISPNQRFVRVEGRWAGRFCKRCFAFCPAGVGDDGLCHDCHVAGQPGCSVCGAAGSRSEALRIPHRAGTGRVGSRQAESCQPAHAN